MIASTNFFTYFSHKNTYNTETECRYFTMEKITENRLLKRKKKAVLENNEKKSLSQ